jgi:hypothetical protein
MLRLYFLAVPISVLQRASHIVTLGRNYLSKLFFNFNETSLSLAQIEVRRVIYTVPRRSLARRAR